MPFILTYIRWCHVIGGLGTSPPSNEFNSSSSFVHVCHSFPSLLRSFTSFVPSLPPTPFHITSKVNLLLLILPSSRAHIYTYATQACDEHKTLTFPPKNNKTTSNINMSTRPCRFFLAGTCRNGTDCRFYHEGFSGIPRSVLTGDSDMSMSTTAHLNGTTTTTSGPAAGGGRSTSGTSPTSSLSASSSSASAAHTPTSSSSSSASSSSNTRPAYAASRPCNWYMAGYCLRGDNCWFSHDRAVIEGRSRGSGGAEDGTMTSPGEANGELTSSTADVTTASANNNNNNISDEDDNEDHKCAICFEVPSTFGLLGNTQQRATVKP